MKPMTHLFAQVKTLFESAAAKRNADVKPPKPLEPEAEENWFDETEEITEGEKKDEKEEVDSDPACMDDEHECTDDGGC